MKITFDILLDQPVLAGGPKTDPNTVATLKYIPGSAIRGSLIHTYLRSGGIEKDVPSIFLSDNLRFLDALPVCKGIENALMFSPVSIYTDPDRDETVFAMPGEIRNANLKRFSCPFIAPSWFEDDEWRFYDVPTMFRFHNERDPDMGHSARNSGSIFRYETILPGLMFRGAVESNDEADLDDIRKFLSEGQRLFIGGSRTAGYGAVSLKRVRDENQKEEPPEAPEDEFYVMMNSVCDYRDEEGQPSADALAARLEKELGAKCIGRDIEWTVAGGFNRKWGFQMPQRLVIAPGSIFRFKKENGKDLPAELLKSGVGFNRNIGWGRLKIFSLENNTSDSINRIFLEPERPERNGISDKKTEGVHSLIETRIQDVFMEQTYVPAQVARLAERIELTEGAAKHIIARMLLIIEEVRTQENSKLAADEFKKQIGKLRSKAVDNLKKIRLDGKRLDEFIIGYLNDADDKIRDELGRKNIGAGTVVTDKEILHTRVKILWQVLNLIMKKIKQRDRQIGSNKV